MLELSVSGRATDPVENVDCVENTGDPVSDENPDHGDKEGDHHDGGCLLGIACSIGAGSVQVTNGLGSSTGGREDEILVDNKVCTEGDSKEHAKEGSRGSPEEESQNIILGHTAHAHESHAVHGWDGSNETGRETSGSGGSGLAGGVLARAEGVSGEAGQGLEDDESENGAPEGCTECPADLESDVEVGGCDHASEEGSDDSRAPIMGRSGKEVGKEGRIAIRKSCFN